MLASPMTIPVGFWERLPEEASEQAENGQQMQKMGPADIFFHAVSPFVRKGYDTPPPQDYAAANGPLHFVPWRAIMIVMLAVGLSHTGKAWMPSKSQKRYAASM